MICRALAGWRPASPAGMCEPLDTDRPLARLGKRTRRRLGDSCPVTPICPCWAATQFGLGFAILGG